jgi:hypothetical protein
VSDRRPLIYLAGPFTAPVPTHNVAAAVAWARKLREYADVAVFVPHLSALHDMLDPQPYEEWMRFDFDIVRRCDALFRFGGYSNGAEREIEFARLVGLPVFHSMTTFIEWMRDLYPQLIRAVTVPPEIEGSVPPSSLQGED